MKKIILFLLVLAFLPIQAFAITKQGATTFTGNINFSNAGRLQKRFTTYSSATSMTPNTDTDDVSYMNNSQGVGTFTIGTDIGANQINGQVWTLCIKSSAVQTFAWSSQYNGGTLGLPTATLGTSTYQIFTFIWLPNNKWNYTGTGGGW